MVITANLSDNNNNNSSDEELRDLLDNPNHRNNFINYTENCYGMVIVLLNHMCCTKLNDYNSKWKYQNIFII